MALHRKGRRRSLWRGQGGATLVEQALVLPLWLGLFFIIRDVYFVGYTWVALQHSVNQGLRAAILGSTLADSETTVNKVDDIKKKALTKIVEMEFRTGLVNQPASVDISQLNSAGSDHSYLDSTLSILASADPTAHGDLTATLAGITVDNSHAALNWWVAIQGQRTLTAGEGKISPVGSGILYLTLGRDTLVFTSKAEGKLEKPPT